MGKLLDKLEKASRGVAQPLGFGSAAKREKVAPMLLLGAIQPGNEAEAKLVADAELDGAIAIVGGKSANGLDAAAKALPEGAVLGAWYEEAQPKDAEGVDFQVFSSDKTPLAALAGEDRTSVMQVVPEMDDSLLRTLDHLPVDAFLVSLADAQSLNVAQLMRLARVRGVTSRWVLVHLSSVPTREELELLRDAGVGAIVVTVAGQTLEALKACKQALLELPRESPDRNKKKAVVTVPSLGGEVQRPAQPTPEPDDDDWDDE